MAAVALVINSEVDTLTPIAKNPAFQEELIKADALFKQLSQEVSSLKEKMLDVEQKLKSFVTQISGQSMITEEQLKMFGDLSSQAPLLQQQLDQCDAGTKIINNFCILLMNQEQPAVKDRDIFWKWAADRFKTSLQ